MKKLILIIILLVLIVFSCIAYSNILSRKEQNNLMSGVVDNSVVNNTSVSENTVDNNIIIKENSSNNVDIVVTGDDTISKDSSWCGIFQLIWNDLKNDLAKQNIIFPNQPIVVDNLNKEGFTTKDITEDSYYKTYGAPTLKLKAEIEKAIKDKFNESSDILDSFTWQEEETEDYFLYGMLKKDFKFDTAFDELPNDKFGNYEDVEYFGALTTSNDDIKDQIRVLYYDSEDSFAIKLLSEDDDVVICKGIEKATFNDIYDEIMKKSESYEWSQVFNKNVDELKVPNIKIDTKKEFTELQNQPFQFSDGREYTISKALQTIKFNLDKTGVKLKSEAGMMATLTAIREPEVETPRYFYVDDSFTIFLKEVDSEKPYFAAHIDDITKYQ